MAKPVYPNMNQQTISLNGKHPAAHLLGMDSGLSISKAAEIDIATNDPSSAALAKDLQIKFTDALVHEVRHPLSNINLAVEMLQSSIKELDLKIYLDIIGRSSMRINDLMCDLLNYEKTEKAPLQKYSVRKLLNEVLRMVEDRITLKKITVMKDYDNGNFRTNAERKKMFIAFTNIMINAIEAMNLGKGELKVTTKLIRRKYVVQIEDNGCGISDENMKNIAKPYFSTKPSGIGIGLSATYNILAENHVAISVESEEGKWTRFTLTFQDNDSYGVINDDGVDRINSSLNHNNKH